jgi:hypothetical protein
MEMRMRTISIGTNARKFVITTLAFAAVAASATSASAQVRSAHPCGVAPTADEVFVYEGPNFSGGCGALYVGYYPTSGWGTGGFGVNNDTISSIKVGSNVRARLFVGPTYSGNYFWFGGYGTWGSMPSGWNDVTSSIRVEVNSRSTACNDLQPGEFALFRDPSFSGDCVVLNYGSSYPTPNDLGIANDTVTGVLGGPQVFGTCSNGTQAVWNVQLWYGLNYTGSSYTMQSGNWNANLSGNNMNDVTSSVGTYFVCI